MKFPRWMRELSDLPLSVITSVPAWLLVAPVAALVPRRRDWIAVIGRTDGKLLDNAKYFFLQASEESPDVRVVFVSEHREVVTVITAGGRDALRYPGLRAIWYLMRCGSAIVDESAWFKRGRRFLLARARIIQLWHGAGFKYIELQKWRRETGRYAWASGRFALTLRLLAYRLTGRLTQYDAVACTSQYYRDNVFIPAFLARHFPITGLPRNDFGQSLHADSRAIAWSNVDPLAERRLESWLQTGRKLVLVAPTFRDSGSIPMQLDDTALEIIDAFAEANGADFLFKFHPAEKNADRVRGRHFHVCARDSDIYPLLPYACALVTDYSSISLDFLWVDKPIVFLIPEEDDYIHNDRALQMDPRIMMPGLVRSDWNSLLIALLEAWNDDRQASVRADFRRLVFDGLPQSQSASRLIAFMREHEWLPSAASRPSGNCF